MTIEELGKEYESIAENYHINYQADSEPKLATSNTTEESCRFKIVGRKEMSEAVCSSNDYEMVGEDPKFRIFELNFFNHI